MKFMHNGVAVMYRQGQKRLNGKLQTLEWNILAVLRQGHHSRRKAQTAGFCGI